MITRRDLLKAGALAGAGAILPWDTVILRNAFGLVPQTPLAGSAGK